MIASRLDLRWTFSRPVYGPWNTPPSSRSPCRITSAQASREFAAQAGDLCTLKIWDGLYHEIHNEPEKEQVFAYLLEWLESKA
jgi:hypothetical protein